MRAARLARTLGALAGKKRAAAAILFGIAAAAILPPLHWLPLGFVGFTGLVWLLADKSPRAAFAIGWLFGLGHFSTSLYWIANALMIEWWRVGWMIPFAVLGLGALLGVFAGFAAMAVRLLRLSGAALPFGLALFWGLGEFARGHVLTGFAWNLVATAWLASDDMAPVVVSFLVQVKQSVAVRIRRLFKTPDL
jgi:apolipoprotein N-acyltransferase